MARAQIGETDSLPASRTYLNANIAKDDALQTATGITESATNIGSIGTLPTGAVQSTDTLRSGLLKVEGRTTVSGPKHGVDSVRTARELGANYDYKTALEGIEGTTAVDISGASAQEYPDADGIYTIEVVRSGGGGGSAGRTIVVTATKGFKRFVRIKSEGTWGAWIQADAVAPATLVTQNDTGRKAYALAAEEWRSRLSGGFYAASYTLAQATSYGMPLEGVPNATVGWLIEIMRTGTLTGVARVSGTYTHAQETTARVHTFTAELSLADESAVTWTVGTWQGVSPRVLPARSVHPESLSIYDWTLTKPSLLTETFPVSPRRTQTGWSATNTVRRLRPAVSGTTYYVDQASGDNSNNGTTVSTPFKTVAAALGATTPGRIYIAPGVYRYAAGAQNLVTGLGTTYQIHFEKWPIRPGEVYLTAGHDAAAFTALGGATPNVYTTACTFLAGVVDFSLKTRNGLPMAYTEVADAAECQLSPGTWYDAGSNTVGFHPMSGTVPTLSIVPLRGLAAQQYGGRQVVSIDGITYIGGTQGLNIENSTATNGGRLWARNCRFMAVNGNGVFVRGVEQAMFEDCEASDCSQDGFNYIRFDATTLTKRIIEVRCKGYDNGWGLLDVGNGSSAHNDVQIIRIGCDYSRNRGPQVADVISAIAWNCGVYTGPSTAFGAAFQNCGFQNIEGATGFYYECSSTANDYDFVTNVGSDVFFDRTEFANVSGTIGTNIRPYDQV